MIKTNSIKAWILAARPKTLAAAAAPVLIGGVYAMVGEHAESMLGEHAESMVGAALTSSALLPFLLCLLFALVMQTDANFINDYYDFKKGTDRQDRLGPERACAQGWVTERAMKIAIVLTSLLACCIGLPLILYGGLWLIAVGIVCVAGAFLYTTKLSYKGWGDLCVVIFFGLIPVFFTYYVICHQYTNFIPYLLGIATGMVIDCLLIINNYRDRNQDAISGKNTLVVRLGARFGLILYWYFGSIGAVMVYVALWYSNSRWCALMIIYLIIHYLTFRKMKKTDGKALNALIGETSRNIIIFAITTCIAFLLTKQY